MGRLDLATKSGIQGITQARGLPKASGGRHRRAPGRPTAHTAAHAEGGTRAAAQAAWRGARGLCVNLTHPTPHAPLPPGPRSIVVEPFGKHGQVRAQQYGSPPDRAQRRPRWLHATVCNTCIASASSRVAAERQVCPASFLPARASNMRAQPESSLMTPDNDASSQQHPTTKPLPGPLPRSCF
jgi:hypothetical protein